MDVEKRIRDRFRVFEKLIKVGYNSDKKMMELKVEDLIISSYFNRSDLVIAIGIRDAIASRNLVAFLCGIDSQLKNSKGE